MQSVTFYDFHVILDICFEKIELIFCLTILMTYKVVMLDGSCALAGIMVEAYVLGTC